MPIWNSEQQKAIYTKDKNILVSASAGSGKTTVLIARLMDLVMNQRVEIDRILAMTFTEAAASEMKKRLASSLQQALKESKNFEEQAYIKKQLSGISNAYISTIHSFCLTTLKKYYYIIGLEPERINRILDEGMMYLLQEGALKQTFQIQYQKNELSFLRICEMFSARSEDDDNLKKAIRNLGVLANTQKDSKKWLLELPKQYDKKQKISELSSELQNYFFDYLNANMQMYLDKCIQLMKLCDTEDEKKYNQLTQKITKINEVIAILEAKDYLLYQKAIKVAVASPTPTSKEYGYDDIRKDLQKLEDKMIAQAFEEVVLLNDIHRLQPIIAKLCEMTIDYMKFYEEFKIRERVIDFDDMEHYTLQILQANKGQIANLYRKQFIQIMVDEFQDSNAVQNELVQLICRENNVFRVGDIKQSIYGFRHAKPDIMRNLIEKKGIHDEVIYLSNNYRSKESIVEFNNILFQQLMNVDGFHKGFAQEDYAYIGLEKQKEENYKISLHLLKYDKDLKMNTHEMKARLIAYQIQQCLKEGFQFKDIAILTRSNAVQLKIKKVLDEYKIPCFMDMKSGFFQSSSVQTIISALKAIDDPYDDIAFIAFLTSPFMQFTLDELAQVKIAKKAKAQQESLEKGEKVYEVSYYEYLKDDELLADFHELRSLRYRKGLSDMINELYLFNDYYELHTNKQEKVNLDLLFDRAVDFEKQSALGIHAFIEQIALIKDSKSGEATSIGKDDDVVRIMSIHQSKGLQFPVVLLYSTSSMASMDAKELFMYDETLGVGLKMMEFPHRYVRPTLIRNAIQHKKNKEELEEEMRILYVATTRAEKQMHIFDVEKKEYYPPLTTATIYERKGYTSWLISMIVDNPSLCELKKYYSIPEIEMMEESKGNDYELKKYDKASKVIKLNSATAYKKKKQYTSLVKNDGGMVYGTMMHKMVELLNQQPISDEVIEKIAKQQGYNLSENDKMKLVKLYQNELFSNWILKECYFELPYQVKKEDEIFSGYLDFMACDQECVTILDFKSDHLQQEHEFIKRYQQQLETYAYAMKQIYPNHQIKTYIYAFYLNKMIEVRV